MHDLLQSQGKSVFICQSVLACVFNYKCLMACILSLCKYQVTLLMCSSLIIIKSTCVGLRSIYRTNVSFFSLTRVDPKT